MDSLLKARAPLFPPPSTSKHKQLFKVKSAELAKQFTWLDCELFARLSPSELVRWAADQAEQGGSVISSLTAHFNRLSFWVRALLLEPDERREREKRFQKFLNVAKVGDIS